MKEDHCPVAIVGMSCFFPKSSGLKAYWRLLFRGLDGITEVPSTHWSKKDFFDPDPRTPDHVYCTRGGFLSPIEFDPSEFGIPPSTLEATDSSQLLALAAAKQVLKESGLPSDRSRTSVILGVTGTQELVIPLSGRLGFPKWRRALQDAGIAAERCEQIIRSIADSYVPWQENSFPGLLGNVVAGRISNRLDLGGTNCVVDAACASSLAAVHLALLELASDRSDMVITGGVDTLNDIFMHMCFAKTQVLSPTGDARPFSKNADGTVLGEGVGLLVLKRLADAERDGNRIYAVIKGIGSASDGRSQSIYSPRSEGQVKALEAAYSAAGIDPAGIGLVEAHGTGTRVGDKVEFQALCQVMGKAAASANSCALGSVKSMIGHTKAAAGAAGLIKAALAVYHKVLPPTLKADEPDPALGLEGSPFYLNTRTRPWVAGESCPRRAGVSAFGFGGSNFHLVLEEHRPEKACIAWDGSVEILAFSADQPSALHRSIGDFIQQLPDRLTEPAGSRAAALSRSRFDGRQAFRLLLVVEHPGELRLDLQKAADALQRRGHQDFFKLSGTYFGGPAERGRLAFLFPGQGSQYAGMGRDLVCLFPASMAVLQHAERHLKSQLLLSDLLYPRPGTGTEDPDRALRAPEAAQPAIGAISLAMLRALEEFGVAPDAVAGHSFGELTALCAAGWIGESDFFDLAAARGSAMAQAEPGSMLAVQAPLAEIEAMIAGSSLPVVLANRNRPDQGVLSGSPDAIAKAVEVCRRSGHAVKQLPVGGAFHSPLMRDAAELFRKALAGVRLTPTSTMVFSNHTAEPYPADPGEARRRLGDHMLRPVDFVREILGMHRAGIRTFVEVGPRSNLTRLVAAILRDRPFQALALDASAGEHSGLRGLAKALCHLAALGFPVRLENWESPEPPAEEARMRIPIAGANFRNPEPQCRQSQHLPPAALTAQSTVAAEAFQRDVPAAGASPALPRQSQAACKETMTKNIDGHTDPITDALRSVQEGLKALQDMQFQTAQAHQKFLETQSEASRAVLELVKNTSRMAGIPVGALENVPAAIPNPAGEPSAPGTSQTSPWSDQPTATPSLEPIPEMASGVPAAADIPAAPRPAGFMSSPPGIEAVLLAVVSELTGYPVEMLGLEMDIEADLGIDSIKRVEILSTLEEKMPGLPAVAPEDMARLKTLGQIIAHMSGLKDPTPAEPLPAQPRLAGAGSPSAPPLSPFRKLPPGEGQLAQRQVPAVTEAPPLPDAAFAIPKGRKVFVTDDGAGISRAITAVLNGLGVNTVLISADILKHRKDLPHAAGLVIVQKPVSTTPEADLKNAFELTHALGADLVESARLAGAFFTTVSRLDGAFGLSGRPLLNPMQGAMAGLAKTAAIEWPEVRCRALDVPPDWMDHRAVAQAVVKELMPRGPVEIGLRPEGRQTLTLTAAPYPDGELNLNPGDVVVISGGARGITAACAVELARRVRPTLILLGRSPEPVPEPDWLRPLADDASIKKALLENEFSAASAKPAEVEARLRQILANREIARTLETLASAGASAHYYTVDIRDAGRVAGILADARARHGPIMGLIHGAGVLEDRLIVDQRVEQFDRVFDTKVKGFLSLMAAMPQDDLRYIICFSSVTARIGNKGQATYAMANEALNKMAQAESQRRPRCRVISVNWGPWQGGMVTASLEREFERQKVTLLPVADGVHSLMQEMTGAVGRPVEVVIGSMLNPARVETAREKSQPPLSILFEREVDVKTYPILKSHVIDGKPVVPMALIAEWFGHGALHENPGLLLRGLEDMRILNGIRLGGESKLIRVLAGKARRKEGFYEVDLELRNGVAEGKDILHSRARAILAEQYDRPPSYRLPKALSCNHYPRSAAEIYEKILFHGSHLHGLRGIQCGTADGMVAEVTGAPDPVHWIASPLRNAWLCDPLVLDSAFQMASLWCYDQRGCVSLPSHAASYRQFRTAFPAQGVRVALEVREATEKRMRGDFTFLDTDGKVVAQLTGYEAIMDPLLNRAFKPEIKPKTKTQ